MNTEKVFILLRHTSGSGSSSFADYLAYMAIYSGRTVEICNTDEFHFVNGEYKFNPEKLGWAHEQCFQKFSRAIECGIQLIIQSNTNCAEKEFVRYQELAEQNGYTFISLVLEKRHSGVNQHGVSDQGLQKQFDKLINGLKLK